jgi:hypothetical protein
MEVTHHWPYVRAKRQSELERSLAFRRRSQHSWGTGLPKRESEPRYPIYYGEDGDLLSTLYSRIDAIRDHIADHQAISVETYRSAQNMAEDLVTQLGPSFWPSEHGKKPIFIDPTTELDYSTEEGGRVYVAYSEQFIRGLTSTEFGACSLKW